MTRTGMLVVAALTFVGAAPVPGGSRQSNTLFVFVAIARVTTY